MVLYINFYNTLSGRYIITYLRKERKNKEKENFSLFRELSLRNCDYTNLHFFNFTIMQPLITVRD